MEAYSFYKSVVLLDEAIYLHFLWSNWLAYKCHYLKTYHALSFLFRREVYTLGCAENHENAKIMYVIEGTK